MTKAKPDETQVFQQKDDDRGRVRLDRPLSAAEATAQEAENVRLLAESVKLRFEGRRTLH